jgi:hypothetical protein
MNSGYPEPLYFSVTAASDTDELLAEYVERDEALALAEQCGGIAWAHGRFVNAKRSVRWRVSL